ncbi:heme o synthase [Propioniciclava sp. MC1595]|uniref:heme o synthase n=1 Tax=Propioniciclava sp. MC1595 TaxID=2760308 RepID=UPI001662591E|nr:heme o synthase [Propioniciclava sp. MC1595]MBB1494516.1 protoheme IX farnesyltransferase [Propioniciclava sp. MC1595]NLE17459.1 protoheme IX farnesyltransferase [Propioniciclava sp.]QTE27114.1 heme o synthase [Propioniciclava sp. MC1595]
MHPARTEAPAPAAAQPGVMGRVQAYVGLTKPRIIELLLVTTFPAMFLAAGGFPPLGLAVITFVGGTLSAASANVFNSVLDADIDEQMRRTRRRPMVREQVSKRAAYTFGVVLGIISTLMLGLGANWLAAALSVTAILYYVFIYTVWLKRRTAQNIVWGGVAGCFPPLIGWTAVTGSVAWPPIILFLIVFFWTPPHTWALGLRYREDYASVDVPMLPVVKDAPHVAWQILVYSVLTVVTSLALWPVAGTTLMYPIVAGIAGAWLVWESVALLNRARAGMRDAALKPMRLFHWSNSYLAIVFIAAAVDPLLPWG